jgi:hypothetical protein
VAVNAIAGAPGLIVGDGAWSWRLSRNQLEFRVFKVRSQSWGKSVKTVAEYRLYAEESRRLAAKMARPEDKQALETIARAWDSVADEREALLLKQIDSGGDSTSSS